MAELFPENLPTLPPELLAAQPPGTPIDRGPNVIDAETVALVADRVQQGLYELPPSAEGALADADMAVVEDMFVRHLDASPLVSRFALEHRALALLQTLNELAGSAPVGAGGRPTPTPELQWALTQLEAHMLSLRPGLAGVMQVNLADPVLDAVLATTALLSGDQLAAVTGITVQQWGLWRGNQQGPPYIKIPGTARSIRYPVGAVIAWLYGVL